MLRRKGRLGAWHALLACTATACGTAPEPGAGESDGAAPLTVTYGCLPSFSNLPRMIAEEVGLAEEAGLDIQCNNIEQGPTTTAALVSGEIGAAQLIPGNMTPLLDQGESLVAFAGTNRTETLQLVVRSGYDLPRAAEGWEGVMRDLEGARIGVVALGGSVHSLAEAMFEQAGVDPDAQTYLATTLSATVAALSSEQIDAALVTEPTTTLAVHGGVAVQPFVIGDETGPPQMRWGSMMLVSGRAYAEENSEALCRLKEVFARGAEYLRDPANREQVVEVMVREMNLEPEAAELTLDRNAEIFPDGLDLDAELWDPNFAFLHEAGQAERAYTAEDYFMDVCA